MNSSRSLPDLIEQKLIWHPEQSAAKNEETHPHILSESFLNDLFRPGTLHEFLSYETGFCDFFPVSVVFALAARALPAGRYSSLIFIGDIFNRLPFLICRFADQNRHKIKNMFFIEAGGRLETFAAAEQILQKKTCCLVFINCRNTTPDLNRRISFHTRRGDSIVFLLQPARNKHFSPYGTSRWQVHPIPGHAESPAFAISLLHSKLAKPFFSTQKAGIVYEEKISVNLLSELAHQPDQTPERIIRTG